MSDARLDKLSHDDCPRARAHRGRQSRCRRNRRLPDWGPRRPPAHQPGRPGLVFRTRPSLRIGDSSHQRNLTAPPTHASRHHPQTTNQTKDCPNNTRQQPEPASPMCRWGTLATARKRRPAAANPRTDLPSEGCGKTSLRQGGLGVGLEVRRVPSQAVVSACQWVVRTATPGRSANADPSAVRTVRPVARAIAAMIRPCAPRGRPARRIATRSSA